MCHRSDVDNIIEKICIQTEKIDTFCIAEPLVKHATIHMHDPEHHFLVLAVLLASYFYIKKEYKYKKK